MRRKNAEARKAYLLFDSFDFDFKSKFPIDLGSGTFLDDTNTVHAAIDSSEVGIGNPLGVEGFTRDSVALTAYRVVGLGCVHVCLSCELKSTQSIADAADSLFLSLGAIRLVSPVHFSVCGFAVVEQGRLIHRGLLNVESNYNPSATRKLHSSELKQVREVNERIRSLFSDGANIRFRSAMTIFLQSSNGSTNSWQMGMLGMFSALDGVFPHPSKKKLDGLDSGPRLANRIRQFIPARMFTARDQLWLANAYSQMRNGIAHGAYSRVFYANRASLGRDFARLHEIARLVLLAYLGLSNTVIASLLPENASGALVFRALQSIGAAPTTYLGKQRRFDRAKKSKDMLYRRQPRWFKDWTL